MPMNNVKEEYKVCSMPGDIVNVHDKPWYAIWVWGAVSSAIPAEAPDEDFIHDPFINEAISALIKEAKSFNSKMYAKESVTLKNCKWLKIIKLDTPVFFSRTPINPIYNLKGSSINLGCFPLFEPMVEDKSEDAYIHKFIRKRELESFIMYQGEPL